MCVYERERERERDFEGGRGKEEQIDTTFQPISNSTKYDN